MLNGTDEHMNVLYRSLVIVGVVIVIVGCKSDKINLDLTDLENAQHELISYDTLKHSEIMVLGTFHFQGNKDILKPINQNNISKLINELSQFNPTKIVVEWEPSDQSQTNIEYQSFLTDTLDIANKENEVYQLGFRFAKFMKHDSIYLFDNQTEFIGSLENFSFKAFGDYAKENDDGFFNVYEESLTSTYEQNQKTLKSNDLYNRIALMNSPKSQKINEQRMHMYEIRVGIQNNWIGADWLGRWYQRNIRMVGNVLKMVEKGDRILVIVGSNHKWTLDMLFNNIPDFEVISSWDYLK